MPYVCLPCSLWDLWSWKRPWEKNGALLFGTVVLLLNIYIIKHVDIFKSVISNVKHSKYIQILQFFNFLDQSLLFTFKYIQTKHFFNTQKLPFFTFYFDTLFRWMKIEIYLKNAIWQIFSNNSMSEVMIVSSNAQFP